jgi:AcrR family transcriptional regulator
MPQRQSMSNARSAARANTRVATEDAEDGRRLRSSQSRTEIVRAMHALIRDGDMSPSAARVAELAGVSLRTVFRHFDDMDSLYREITTIVEAELQPLLQRPLEGGTWRARLDNLLTRRADIYDRIMPHRIAGSLRRFSSSFLMEDYQRFVRKEREGLRAILPAAIVADPVLFAALEAATGFQAWRRMRQDQKLSAKDAQAVMAFTVERLTAGR